MLLSEEKFIEMQREEIHRDPCVFTIKNFISNAECEHMINISKNQIIPALVSGEKEGFISKGRSGQNCWINHDHDSITRDIAERISKLIAIPIENAEAFQIIYYDVEQEYRQHYDGWLLDGGEKSRRNMKYGGQRVKTALVYLNNVTKGGGTKFTKLNKEVNAEMGKLLVFNNVYEGSSERHELSEHAGMPVIEGEKWAFNLWFREQTRKVLYKYPEDIDSIPSSLSHNVNLNTINTINTKYNDIQFKLSSENLPTVERDKIIEKMEAKIVENVTILPNKEVTSSSVVDNWVSPFSIKIVHDFLDEKYYQFLDYLIKNKQFDAATQGVGNKQLVQEEHKIRYDYTLNNIECEFIDKPLVYKADCNCNLRERWRLLYYNGDDDKKCFRDAHTDWTSYSCHRRMSIIIGLNDPMDYEGGELVFRNNNLTYKIEKGAAVIFDGKLLHEVLPVTKGKRYVLQCFMFDDSGYDLKKVKNGKENFTLLGPDINRESVCVKKLFDQRERDIELGKINKIMEENMNLKNELNRMNDNTDWLFLENRNAVHSRISSTMDSYIGTFKYQCDLLNYLEKNKEIGYFTWHKPTHHNSKWAGRAYGWTHAVCEQKGRTDSSKWPTEYNILSGCNVGDQIKLSISEINRDKLEGKIENPCVNLTEEERNSRYLTIIGTDGGPGNQIVGIKEAIIMAKILERKLLFPPILQHYVLNRAHRGSGRDNMKYWKFSEIFEYRDEKMKVLESVENKHIINNTKTQLFLRQNDIDTPLRMEDVLELESKNKRTLTTRFFKNMSDYNELKTQHNEHMLTVTHLYNCTAISQCSWNGCDTCEMNPVFFEMYREICSKLDFSHKIKNYGDEYIHKTFGKEEFICLHLRYPDYGGVDIKSINKLYNETDINNLISKLCEREDIPPNNVFVATCNQGRILKTDLKYGKMLTKKSEYNEMESFIEQYIATRSKLFVYTGGIHAKPDHQHLRSTWSSLVCDYRSYLLNKEKMSNIYLTNQFN